MKKTNVPLDDIYPGNYLIVESDKVSIFMRQLRTCVGDDEALRDIVIEHYARADQFPIGDLIYVVACQVGFLRCVRLDDPGRVLTIDSRLYRFMRADRAIIYSYPAEARRAAQQAARLSAAPRSFSIAGGSARRPQEPPTGSLAA